MLGLEASSYVAFVIEKEKKPHAIWEWLIKPYAINMVKLVCGREQKKKLWKDYLPNSMLSYKCYVCDILGHVANENRSNKAWDSLSLVGSTDVSNYTYFLIYRRYILHMQLKEEFFMCVSLETTSEVTDDQEEMNNFYQ